MSKESGNSLEVSKNYDFYLSDKSVGIHIVFGESSFQCFYDICEDILHIIPDRDSSVSVDDVRRFVNTLSISKCVKRIVFFYEPF